MNKKGLVVLITVAGGGGFMVGCASSSSQQLAELEQSPVGAELVVDRSEGSRPDWIVSPPEEKDDMKFFSGGEEGVTDFALGMRMAKAEAWQDMGESVLAVWSSLFQASDVSDSETLDRYGRNFQELAVKELEITGVEAEERYYEKVAVKTAYGVEHQYNTFVLISVPANDWRTAQHRALQKLRDRASAAQDTRAEEYIDQAIERLDEIWP